MKLKKGKNMKNKILCIAILIGINCSPFQQYYKFSYDDLKVNKIKTIMLIPLAMIREPPQGASISTMNRLEESINAYLIKNGFNIISNELLTENWKEVIKGIPGFYDPATGQIDLNTINSCLLQAIEKTKQKKQFDGVLFFQLIERPANLMGDRVYWDGCSRHILDDDGQIITDVTWRGESKALSLLAQLFDGNNNLIFQNIGAIEFPYELQENYNSKELKWKDTLQFKQKDILEGIAIALHPLIFYSKYPQKPNFYE